MSDLELWDTLIAGDNFKPDKWQAEVLAYKGNITIRAGRQVGKSTIISFKAGRFALENPGTTTLIIAASQRQSSLLFEKTRALFEQINDELIERAKKEQEKEWNRSKHRQDFLSSFRLKYGLFAEQPTMTKLILKNGSRIYSLPAGKTGIFIRGFTIDLLIADEAAYIPEAVWLAVKPMIAVSKQMRGLGWIILISTPFGKGGYFYDSFTDCDFRSWHVSSESCPRISRDFLTKERGKLTKVEYAQEYLGEFVDEFNQMFPTELIKKRMTFFEWNSGINSKYSYYLGVDVARFGEDENAFILCEMIDKKHLRIIFSEISEKKSLTSTAGRVIALDQRFHFKKIFIDSAGVGGGLYDMLSEKLGRRVEGLENARKTIDKDGRKGKLFKEDLYSNALVIMETEPASIEIISDLKLLKSLKSMTFEYTSDASIKIFGKYSHLAEAFVRALWCVKSKGLNLYCA